MCSDCKIGRGRRPGVSHKSKTAHSLRDLQPGEGWTVDEADFSRYFTTDNKQDKNFRCYFSHDVWVILFVCIVSKLPFAYFTSKLDSTEYIKAEERLRGFVASTVDRKVKFVYFDPASSHLARVVQLDHVAKRGCKLEVSPPGAHTLMHEVERQHNELRASARTLVRGLIGRKVPSGIIKDMKGASVFVNLAYWRAVIDRWNTPNLALLRQHEAITTPGMAFWGTDIPPNFTAMGQREFGARCLTYMNDERAGQEPVS